MSRGWYFLRKGSSCIADCACCCNVFQRLLKLGRYELNLWIFMHAFVYSSHYWNWIIQSPSALCRTFQRGRGHLVQCYKKIQSIYRSYVRQGFFQTLSRWRDSSALTVRWTAMLLSASTSTWCREIFQRMAHTPCVGTPKGLTACFFHLTHFISVRSFANVELLLILNWSACNKANRRHANQTHTESNPLKEMKQNEREHLKSLYDLIPRKASKQHLLVQNVVNMDYKVSCCKAKPPPPPLLVYILTLICSTLLYMF